MEAAEHLPHDHARGLQTAGRLAAEEGLIVGLVDRCHQILFRPLFVITCITNISVDQPLR
jgi:hypothetical protein